MKPSICIFLLLLFSTVSIIYAQNVGIGTTNPLEKLHVTGSIRADGFQTALVPAATTDKIVWVDTNGKMSALANGAAGKVLGISAGGILSWLTPPSSLPALNNGQIWIGNASNVAVGQTLSGDASVSNTGLITIQDNSVDGTDITISGESNGSLMFFNGTNWINIGIGTAGQVLTTSGGIPAWVSPTSLILVDNGLNFNNIAGKIRQGGALVENTTITQGNFNYIHSLSGTGVFEARNGATSGAGLFVNPSNNVGIGTAAPTNKLHVVGTTRITSLQTATATSASTDKLVWANSNGVLSTLPTGTAGNILTLDASGIPDWAANASWLTTGNNLSTVGIIGSLTNQDIDFYTNNTLRGHIETNDGSLNWGAIASPYAGDGLNAMSTPTLIFALSGYCSDDNGAGTWGEVMAATNTAFSAVQGVYGGTGMGAGALGNYNGTNTGATRAGIVGVCTTPAATNGGIGVYGRNGIAAGNTHIGVLGEYNTGSFGLGVIGLSDGGAIMPGDNDVAVVGWRANNANYSGYFNGNHVIANGTKSASVPTTKGNQLLYCMESPEVWFEDFGTAQLVNGTATVNLDALFLETVLIDDKHPLHVFVQVQGECEDVYVIPNTQSFQVKEKNQGTSNVQFSYRVVAKRYHFADHRFGNDPVWGKGDTREYSQKAPARPIDYEEGVKMDIEAKKNYKRAKMPEGFIYPEDQPQPALERTAESRRTE